MRRDKIPRPIATRTADEGSGMTVAFWDADSEAARASPNELPSDTLNPEPFEGLAEMEITNLLPTSWMLTLPPL